ncbi:thymidine kinase [Streptomyces buecherae]|uniref:thymidine kinase n=1 Tax=Streptomyces buecherae TaxID=2763006 RepID=UPI0033C0E41D
MPELVFFSGTMDCGKSTLALQIEHNRSARGLQGMIFTRDDRAGEGRLSSRLGLETDAIEAHEGFDFYAYLVAQLSAGSRADYVIADEAQFLAAEQIDQLARVVDDLGLDVFAFGITTDFRSRLFPGSQRLVELADRIEVLQVEALCWCGARATHNARTVGGRMVVEGAQVVVGDVRKPAHAEGADAADPTSEQDAARDGAESGAAGADGAAEVGYEVLCRRHHRRRMTASAARAATLSPEVLPVDGAQPTTRARAGVAAPTNGFHP